MALSYSVRPGGLTALSILNFIIAGSLFFSMISTGWMISCLGAVGNATGAAVDLGKAYAQLGFDLVSLVLLILAGVGYLRLNRGLGQIVGNIYVLVGVAQLVFQIATNGGTTLSNVAVNGQQPIQGGVDMGVLLNKLYVLVTFVFVNFVFSDVWSNAGMIAQAAKGAKSRERFTDQSPYANEPESAIVEGVGAVPDASESTAGNAAQTPKPRVFELILDYSLRQTLRGAAGVLTIFVGSSVVLWLAQIPYLAIDITNALQGQTGGAVSQSVFVTAVISALRPVLAAYLGITGPDNNWAESMMGGPSGIYDLSVIVVAAIIPIFTVMIAGTQISSDNRLGGLRFLLPRVERRDIFRGKVVATLVVVALMVILLNLLNYTYFVLHYRIGDPGELFVFTLRGIFVHLLIAIPTTVLGVTVSGLIDSPGVSWITATGIVLWPIIPSILSTQVPALKIGEFLMPHRSALYGFHPDLILVLVAIVACAAYTALFYVGGQKLFGRRDL